MTTFHMTYLYRFISHMYKWLYYLYELTLSYVLRMLAFVSVLSWGYVIYLWEIFRHHLGTKVWAGIGLQMWQNKERPIKTRTNHQNMGECCMFINNRVAEERPVHIISVIFFSSVFHPVKLFCLVNMEGLIVTIRQRNDIHT